MDRQKELNQIATKLQDLVRDCQFCMHQTSDPDMKDFFGQLARENGQLAHRCLDKIRDIK